MGPSDARYVRRGGPGRRVRRVLRVAGWNALLIAAGLGLLAVAGEIWFRSTVPFLAKRVPGAFVPGVGYIGKPGAEARWTDGLDFWQISRFNRHGFLDREPPDAEPAAVTCHVTVIGDSFVEAREVPITDKLHVRLEALAAQRLSRLNVTTSAFGRWFSGQLNQLAWYDEFARKRAPKLVVLVFHWNDYVENSPLLTALLTLRDPDRLPDMMAERTADGAYRLRPPSPEYEDDATLRSKRARYRLLYPPPPHPRIMRYVRVGMNRAARWSHFGAWLDAKARAMRLTPWRMSLFVRAAALRQEHPEAGPLLDSWPWTDPDRMHEPFGAEWLPPPFAAELQYTIFALDQFRQRADRDGASLAILATHHLRPGDPLFDRMRAIAGDLEIPVISLYDHIVRQGGRIRDAHWRHDDHWTPAGHQWAAEALLEHLSLHPDVCMRGPSSDADSLGRRR